MGERILYFIIQGLLFSAALMDLFWQEVYDFIWILMIPAAATLLFISGNMSAETVISLTVYFFIQEFIMSKVYGKADCHALWCCGLSLSAMGGGLLSYTIHLSLTFFMMCIHQLMKRNIGPHFRLKKEIPMIPYIMVGFWITGMLFS